LVLLGGEAGVGKTALVQQVSRAVERTTRVHSRRCRRHRRQRAMNPNVHCDIPVPAQAAQDPTGAADAPMEMMHGLD
jgi:predicted ATPase